MDTIALLTILLAGLIPGLYMIAQNTALAALRNRTRQAWSEVDSALRRRHDLIPGLVEVAQIHAPHEGRIFDRVLAAREKCATSRGPISSQAVDQKELVTALQALLGLAEASPVLKEDAQFQSLLEELTGAEDRIQAGRRIFNEQARTYRNKCESFPSSVVAGMFGFQPINSFDVDPATHPTTTISLAS